jgi:hypothetical protein
MEDCTLELGGSTEVDDVGIVGRPSVAVAPCALSNALVENWEPRSHPSLDLARAA